MSIYVSLIVILLLSEFVVCTDMDLFESIWVMDDLIWLMVLCTWNEKIRWNIMFVVWCIVDVWKWEYMDILFYVTSCLRKWWYVKMREWWKLNVYCGVNTPWCVEKPIRGNKMKRVLMRYEKEMKWKELWCDMKKMWCGKSYDANWKSYDAKWDWWAGCQGDSLKFIWRWDWVDGKNTISPSGKQTRKKEV